MTLEAFYCGDSPHSDKCSLYKRSYCTEQNKTQTELPCADATADATATAKHAIFPSIARLLSSIVYRT